MARTVADVSANTVAPAPATTSSAGDAPPESGHPADIGRRRWSGVLAAATVAAVAGVGMGGWTPRGPLNAAQALTAMAAGFAVGAVAAIAMRTRWAVVVAPAAFAVALEVVRLDSTGPTVDGISLTSTYGVLALVVGRLWHGLLVLAPMAVGVLVTCGWLRRRPPSLAPPGGRQGAGVAVRRAATAVVALGLLVLAMAVLRPARTDPILGGDGEPLAGSIAELRTIEIGGHDQVLLVRGNRVDNPVLLFLAGGPGGSELGTMSRYGDLLEQDFVVVTWDQRGTGASYGGIDPTDTLTFDQVIADTIAVTEHLRATLPSERVYLVGNSYGTLVGVRAVQERPDLFAAYIGAGQMVDVQTTDRMFYDDALSHAERTGDRGLADTLRANGPPPYDDLLDYAPLVQSEQEWNDYADVEGHQGRREPLEHLLQPEYSLLDKVHAVAGLLDTYSVLYPQLQDLDLRATAPTLDVPVYLVQGRYEARGRAEPAAEWFAALEAPSKQLVTFALSGHRPFVEEPEAFHEVLTGTVLAETLAPGSSHRSVVIDTSTEPADELLDLFERYNRAVWPAPIVASVVGVAALAAVARRPGRTTDRAVTAGLAAMWLWLGVVFHARYAAGVDALLGALYATLFVVQAALLVRAGLLRDRLSFTGGRGSAARLGWAALAYALVVYPLIGVALGHGYPEAPLFGVAPCPSTIATFGLLLLARPPLPRHLLVIPLVWAVLAPLAAVGHGVPEDLGLFVVGALTAAVVLVRDRDARSRPLAEAVIVVLDEERYGVG